MFILHDGELIAQGSPQSFEVKPIPILADRDLENTFAFHKKMNDMSRSMNAAGRKLGEISNRLRYIDSALMNTSILDESLFKTLSVLKKEQSALSTKLYGDRVMQSKDVNVSPSLFNRLSSVQYGLSGTSLAPTETHKTNIAIAEEHFAEFSVELDKLVRRLKIYEEKVADSGAPYTPGRALDGG